ncbi:RNA-binding protein [Bacillus lacus]|uniref:RNA-binding protein n=1 Tax=Metabacillus lacus TaxID=1983721 RepID=A0A7X2J0S1_9BACI|nr:RNA-binding protein [Metabacillus lacus]MRX73323.1 RNA-binding protein [Metabacillus lacus]
MNHIYQHFRPEERQFIEKVQEWKDQAEANYAPKLTDFLDPREQDIVQSVAGAGEEVLLQFSGGGDSAERKRALFYPSYLEPRQDDFHLSFLEVRYPAKFVSLDHRNVLGALMSLGLKRPKFGDILVGSESVQIIAAKEAEDYIMMNLTEIGRSKVSVRKIEMTDIVQQQSEEETFSATVSSLRIDAVAAAVYKQSRQKIQPYISNGLVKVNWRIVDQNSFECREGDTISVRGFGRSKLTAIDGKTKKDKWRITVAKQK